MSKTAAYVRYAVVPSLPRLPLEHPGLSIANRRPFSSEFFNTIDPEQTAGLLGSRRSTDQVDGSSGEGRERSEQPGTIHHWITSSARCSSGCGIVRPSTLAVLRLITSSNFVGCSMGRSAGFAPLKILSTYTAACRYISGKS